MLERRGLLAAVREALQQRHPPGVLMGVPVTPAEVVLRMLLLKHTRNWSFAELGQEVRANLVYRQFTRIRVEKAPDANDSATAGPRLRTAQAFRRICDLHPCNQRFLAGFYAIGKIRSLSEPEVARPS